MISLAKKYNFDLVKFFPEITTPDFQKEIMRETPWGLISYLEYKKKIEFGFKEFKIIDEYCKKIKIGWFASAFDIDSQKFLKVLKINIIKLHCNDNK